MCPPTLVAYFSRSWNHIMKILSFFNISGKFWCGNNTFTITKINIMLFLAKHIFRNFTYAHKISSISRLRFPRTTLCKIFFQIDLLFFSNKTKKTFFSSKHVAVPFRNSWFSFSTVSILDSSEWSAAAVYVQQSHGRDKLANIT